MRYNRLTVLHKECVVSLRKTMCEASFGVVNPTIQFTKSW